MADLAHPWSLRIAFAFGDERLAAHVCEAVSGEAELVYTAPAGEFDVARLASDHVDALLVNADAGDAMGDLETRLGTARVRVVFNDPESSATLEGWARARWLRHLMAKLRGDANVDPPRPGFAGTAAPAAVAPAAPEVPEAVAPAPAAEPLAAVVNDVAAPVDAALELGLDDVPLAPVEGVAGEPEAPDAGSASTAGADAVAAAPEAAAVAPPEADAGDPLDVDTEALSAMIDARLAEPDAIPSADDLDATWAIPSPSPSLVADSDSDLPAPVTDAAAPPGAPEVVVSGDVADGDILASLPSLDEWTLVDPDAVPVVTHGVAGTPAGPAAPAVSDGLGAGLELLPLDGVAPALDKEELVKRWLHESEVRQHADGGKA